MKRGHTSLGFPLVFLGSCGVLALLQGCEMLARSQGQFPVASSFGEKAIGPEGLPLSEILYLPAYDANGIEVPGKKVPLVRIAYRESFDGDLITDGSTKSEKFQQQSNYMVIDVTNVVKNPRLGATTDAEFKERLKAIAEMLIIAGDWNGEVYWRHLTTFMVYYQGISKGAKVGLGAGIAASFVNPVVGASIAGGALVVDTVVGELTSSLNVDEYAEMRDAASTFRKVIKERLFLEIDEAKPGADAVNGVLHHAYDYAYTYSIKGAIHAATQQNKELKNLLITGQSEWQQYFSDEILRNQVLQVQLGKITDPQAVARVKAMVAADEVRKQKEREQQDALTAIAQAKKLAEASGMSQEQLLHATQATGLAEVARIASKKAAAAKGDADQALKLAEAAKDRFFDKVKKAAGDKPDVKKLEDARAAAVKEIDSLKNRISADDDAARLAAQDARNAQSSLDIQQKQAKVGSDATTDLAQGAANCLSAASKDVPMDTKVVAERSAHAARTSAAARSALDTLIKVNKALADATESQNAAHKCRAAVAQSLAALEGLLKDVKDAALKAPVNVSDPSDPKAAERKPVEPKLPESKSETKSDNAKPADANPADATKK